MLGNYRRSKICHSKIGFRRNYSIDQKILNRYLYAADPLEDKTCSKCPYLPICFGGCPHKRIENIFKDKHYDTCTYLKGSLKEFIKIHLSQNS